MTDVIFLTSWMPTEMLRLAHDHGFTVALLSVPMPELERRNSGRLAEGGSGDVSRWFESQLENYADLGALGLIDVVLDGTLTTGAPDRGRVTSPFHARSGLDGVSEGIAVGVLAHEGGVENVRGVSGERRDAARRADRCSFDVRVIALVHEGDHPRERGQRRPC